MLNQETAIQLHLLETPEVPFPLLLLLDLPIRLLDQAPELNRHHQADQIAVQDKPLHLETEEVLKRNLMSKVEPKLPALLLEAKVQKHKHQALGLRLLQTDLQLEEKVQVEFLNQIPEHNKQDLRVDQELNLLLLLDNPKEVAKGEFLSLQKADSPAQQ